MLTLAFWSQIQNSLKVIEKSIWISRPVEVVLHPRTHILTPGLCRRLVPSFAWPKTSLPWDPRCSTTTSLNVVSTFGFSTSWAIPLSECAEYYLYSLLQSLELCWSLVLLLTQSSYSLPYDDHTPALEISAYVNPHICGACMALRWPRGCASDLPEP